MFFAGEVSKRARWLCDMTKEAMYEGIKQCGPGVPVNAVGKVGCGHTISNCKYCMLCSLHS